MRGTLTGWESDFPRPNGTRKDIRPNDGQVTVTSYISRTGGHSAMIQEFNVGGAAWTRKVHLQHDEHGKIIINVEPLIDGDRVQRDATDYFYTCYDMNESQRVLFDDAVNKFIRKNRDGRYSYRLAGGIIGRLTTKPGKRGVNCADFVKKILADAKIATFGESPISMPKTVARHSGSLFVDLP